MKEPIQIRFHETNELLRGFIDLDALDWFEENKEQTDETI